MFYGYRSITGATSCQDSRWAFLAMSHLLTRISPLIFTSLSIPPLYRIMEGAKTYKYFEKEVATS
jgi:hypothetical protein